MSSVAKGDRIVVFKRRKSFSRRSGFRQGGGRRAGLAPILLSVAALGLVIGFFWLVGVADDAEPVQTETRIELPDALKTP